jgi:division protein CdvB (Snf7/Vps24/ESCRT-III family)
MDQHQQHLKSDLTNATIVVSNQLAKLKMLDKRISLIDKDFRYKIACNLKKGNNRRARVMANELSNIHHVKRISQNMCLALEVIVLRFSTISEFAKILETVNPTIETIKDIQNDIWNVVPTATGLFNEMTSVTSEVLLNSKVKVDSNIISTGVDMDALSILDEVEDLLEDEAKAKLPDVPDTISHVRSNTSEVQEEVLDGNRVLVES